MSAVSWVSVQRKPTEATRAEASRWRVGQRRSHERPSFNSSTGSRRRIETERIGGHGFGWDPTYERKSERAFALPAIRGSVSPTSWICLGTESTILFIVGVAARPDFRSTFFSESRSFSVEMTPEPRPKSLQNLRRFYAGSKEFQADSNSFGFLDRKSTRLNSSHRCISYAVFCL